MLLANHLHDHHTQSRHVDVRPPDSTHTDVCFVRMDVLCGQAGALLTSMQGVSVMLYGHAHAPSTHVHNFNFSSAHAHVCGRDSHTCSHSRVHAGVQSTRHALAHPHPHPHPPALCTRRTHARTSTSTRIHAPLVRLIRTVKIARVDLSLYKFKTNTNHTRAWSTAQHALPHPHHHLRHCILRRPRCDTALSNACALGRCVLRQYIHTVQQRHWLRR
jgi:hypothetical protein